MRLQFEVRDERVEHIDQLQEKLGLSTRTELFNNALALLNWAIEQKEEGCKIASIRDEDQGYRELIMPSLEKVKTRLKHANAD